MKYRFLAGICFVCSSLFLGCSQPESHDLSVEGIWICTTETAFDFPEHVPIEIKKVALQWKWKLCGA
jgi:hypothetical protein